MRTKFLFGGRTSDHIFPTTCDCNPTSQPPNVNWAKCKPQKGTWRQHPENTQRKLRYAEHSQRTLRTHSEVTQRTLKVHSENTHIIHREHSDNTHQRTFKEHSPHLCPQGAISPPRWHRQFWDIYLSETIPAEK